MERSKNTVSDPLAAQGFGLIVALGTQYILGVSTTFFVQFPQEGSQKQLWEFAWTQVPLVLHILLGLMLTISSSVLLIRAVRQKNRIWIIAASVGFAAIVVAAFAGSRFISLQADSYSYAMALAFIVACLAYAWGIFISRRT